MSQVKDYQVNYSINVTATEGVQEVERFARAMSSSVKPVVLSFPLSRESMR